MISLLILLLLITGFMIGYKRGFILQLFHLIKFIASFIIASLLYDVLSPHLALWIPYPKFLDNSVSPVMQLFPLEKAFYNVVAFIIVFIIALILLHIIASLINNVASLPGLRIINKILGAALGFIQSYLFIFVIIFILSYIPNEKLQQWVNDSAIAIYMINHTPFLSSFLKGLFFLS